MNRIIQIIFNLIFVLFLYYQYLNAINQGVILEDKSYFVNTGSEYVLIIKK